MLCWNVFNENFNRKEIEVINVFEHTSFYEDCKKAARKYKDDREKFLDEVRRSLMYYYWSKCEWEIILTSWPPPREGREFRDKKVDVFEQIRINWDIFCEYIWNNRKEFLKRTRKKVE